MQYTVESAESLNEWLKDYRVNYQPAVFGPVMGLIPTWEGIMEATPGDWIIRGIKGEFYACKPDIFDLTYEAIE